MFTKGARKRRSQALKRLTPARTQKKLLAVMMLRKIKPRRTLTKH
jgi:hypothetical protein